MPRAEDFEVALYLAELAKNESLSPVRRDEINSGWEIVTIVLICGSGVLTFFCVFGNFLILVMYAMNYPRNTVHQFHVVQLAFCDLFAGLTVMLPFHIDFYFPDGFFSDIICTVLCLLHYILGTESLLVTILISIDRLMILRRGAGHRRVYTVALAAFVIFLTWSVVVSLMATLFALSPKSGDQWPSRHLNETTCENKLDTRSVWVKWLHVGLHPVIVCLVLSVNFALLRKLYRIKLLPTSFPTLSTFAIFKSNPSLAPYSASMETVPTSPIYLDPQTGMRVKSSGSLHRQALTLASQQERFTEQQNHLLCKGTWLILQSVVVFLVCYVPYTTSLTVEIFLPGTISSHVFTILLWLFLLKHSLNPFLYARNVNAFSRSYQRMLMRLQRLPYCPRAFRSLCCPFKVLFQRYSTPMMDSSNQTSLPDILDLMTSSTSFIVNEAVALDYLWRDPRITKPCLCRYSRNSSWKFGMDKKFVYVMPNMPPDPNLVKWVLPMLVLSGTGTKPNSGSRNTSADTSSCRSGTLNKKYIMKNSSLSMNSFRLESDSSEGDKGGLQKVRPGTKV